MPQSRSIRSESASDASTSMGLEIEAQDVIKVILQFCKENSLQNSFLALQNECQVSLNTVDNVESFASDVTAGRWDAVLPQVAGLKLPRPLLEDLYELIVLEMAELRELDTARALLRQAAALAAMKQEQPERFLRLEHMLQRPLFDARDAYGDVPRDRRRAALAQLLAAEVTVVPPGRLMALIGQALKWQQHVGLLPPGTALDLFRGKAPAAADAVEVPPKVEAKAIKFGAKSHPECARFAPDGATLATGSVDGFIELWDVATGKLRKDLGYQAEEKFLMHESPVLCLAFSRDSEMLASGAQDGRVKLWRVATGSCLRRLDAAHTAGVTSLSFARDGTQLLTSSFDGTVRVHGLKSGRVIKELRGHGSYVNDAAYAVDGARLVSASSDGTLKIWDAKDGACLMTARPTTEVPGGAEPAVLAIVPHPRAADSAIVCARCPDLYVFTLAGQMVRTLPSGGKGDLTSVAVSPRGEWLYAGAEDGRLLCFNLASGKMEHAIQAHGKAVIGVAHHPHRNLVATWSDDGVCRLWKP